MKITLAWTTAVAAVAAIGAPSLASAADIRVIGARDTVAMRGSSNAMRGGADAGANADADADADANAADMKADVKVKIATADILNKPTALINKNTLAMDNNVFVSRSNIVFSQSDRLALARALAKKVEQLVTSAAASSDSNKSAKESKDMDADTNAVLTKSVLRAVSGRDSDAALMTKASAVVAAKDGDAGVRGQRIADLVRAALDAKLMRGEQSGPSEQSIQSETPRGVIIMVGTKDILRQPTAAVNKNIAVTDTQVAISRSHVAPSQNDNIVLAGGAKVADAVLPASAIDVQVDKSKSQSESESEAETKTSTTEDALDNYRVGFLYNKNEAVPAAADGDDTMDKKEYWGGGLGFGWRYPLGYWNLYGAGLYGGIGGCGLGLAYGPHFYC